ncbi:MAG: TetR/AcrR family transcriptional regulator [Myxococcota bacterium]
MSESAPSEEDIKAKRLQAVLEQCDDLFFTYGFKRVSMDEVVHRLGMSKKTLYQLIPNKDALIEAFVERTLKIRHETMARVLEAEPDLITGTAKMLELFQSQTWRVSAAMTMDLQRHWPHLFERIEQARRQGIRRYIERLAGKNANYLRDDLHRDVLTHMIEAMVMQVVTPQLLVDLNLSVSQAMRTVLEVMLGGMLNDKGRRRLARARKSPAGS